MNERLMNQHSSKSTLSTTIHDGMELRNYDQIHMERIIYIDKTQKLQIEIALDQSHKNRFQREQCSQENI